MKVVISSGHGKYVRGAAGYIDEVDEARRVVERVGEILNEMDVDAITYHDDVSQSQNENLNRIVDFHNSQGNHDLDVSVHFNAYETTSKPMGCEVLYVSAGGFEYADEMVDNICRATGLVNRGPKERTDLFFLNNTAETAILVETCFVDSSADVDIYRKKFETICGEIAESIAGKEADPEETAPDEEPTSVDEISEDEQVVILDIVDNSEIASYSWDDRGEAPDAYLYGFAMTWAGLVKRYLEGDPVVVEMAKANTGNADKDVLAWYDDEFDYWGMSNKVPGLDTLRHLMALQLGLGMRESSGKHCVGRDQSASNVTADTAEAGLYQTSYNAHSSSPRFDEIMADYENGLHPSYIELFSDGITCSSADWQNYGEGRGAIFQQLCKEAPAFAIESCAIVLRNLRQHYGPINRKEAELKREADWMLLDVQRYIMRSGGHGTV